MAKKKATKKKATKKTAARRTSKAKEMLIVGSKAKEALRSTGLNVSGETLAALNESLYEIITRAQERCVNNGRKTVRPTDV